MAAGIHLCGAPSRIKALDLKQYFLNTYLRYLLYICEKGIIKTLFGEVCLCTHRVIVTSQNDTCCHFYIFIHIINQRKVITDNMPQEVAEASVEQYEHECVKN